MYTIKQFADLGGVTTRTLRYYDQLGLIHPAQIGANGYRYYDRASLLRLQQVLFFRELGVPLREIGEILQRPGFDPLGTLLDHRQALQAQVDRLHRLVDTLDKTILNLQGEHEMNDQDYFKGFDETRYQAEVEKLWGSTPQYRESNRKWASYSEEQRQEIKAEGARITARMVTEDPNARPDDPAVQAAVGEYYDYMNRYFYTFDVEYLRGLAEMWVADPRFAATYERIREGGAAFVREAVQIFCDRAQS